MFIKKFLFIKSLLNFEKFVFWILNCLKNVYKIGIVFVFYGIEIFYIWYLVNIYKIFLIFDNCKINVYSKRNGLLKKNGCILVCILIFVKFDVVW